MHHKAAVKQGNERKMLANDGEELQPQRSRSRRDSKGLDAIDNLSEYSRSLIRADSMHYHVDLAEASPSRRYATSSVGSVVCYRLTNTLHKSAHYTRKLPSPLAETLT